MLDSEQGNATNLWSVLKAAGKNSQAPKPESPKVTQQLAAMAASELIVQPLSNIWVVNKTAALAGIDFSEQIVYNWSVGLPNFVEAVEAINQYISLDYIPIWRDQHIALDRIGNEYLQFTNTDGQDNSNAVKFELFEKNDLQNEFIQFDYDYCGRVLQADRGTGYKGFPAWKENKEPELDSIFPCYQTDVVGSDSATGSASIRENKAYAVEQISVKINNLILKSDFEGSLDYEISGVVPLLNGEQSLKMRVPKEIILSSTDQLFGSDMKALEKVPQIGPGYLPVYENCQIFVASDNDGLADFEDILAYKLGQMDATEKMLEYMRGEHTANMQFRGLLLSAIREMRTESENYKSTLALQVGVIPEQIEHPTYLVCMVQTKGSPPVVSMKRVSTRLTAEMSSIRIQ